MVEDTTPDSMQTGPGNPATPAGRLVWQLPDWLWRACAAQAPLADEAAQMRFVIELARRNVAEGSGGPFAAAVVEQGSGAVVGVGVNLVLSARCSLAHAEMLAIAFAQQARGSHDLSAPGQPAHVLLTSCEPCAMCFGAIPWSGVRKVICAARDADARSIGFDEGAKPADWALALAARNIEVATDVCRAESVAVLQDYQRRGGLIYNSRQQARP